MFKVLDTIANAVVAYGRHPARNSLSAYRALRDFRELQALSDQQLRNVSRYVIDKKYVTVRKSGDGTATIEISRTGEAVLRHQSLVALKPVQQKTWDRKWRIVVFDIPNRMKTARDGFAATLKRLGFQGYQKSIFICPFPCEEEIEVVADYFNITDFVELIVADRITHSEQLLKLFKLT